jgi:RHS repeat-associated protein
VTTLDYDGSGRLDSVTQPDPDDTGPLAALESTLTYNGSGQIASHTLPTGGTTSFTYGDFGMLESSTTGGVTEEFDSYFTSGMIDTTGGYGGSGNPADFVPMGGAVGSIEQPDSGTTTFVADPHGLPLQVTDDEGHVTLWERDKAGRTTRRTDPDPDGTGPLGVPISNVSYDGQGNLASASDDAGSESWTFDEDLNLPLTHTDRNNHLTVFEYDAVGNLTLLRNVFGNVDDEINLETDDVVTEMTYTPAPTGSGDPPAGLLASITDPLGRLTELEYNERGLLTTVTFAVGTTVEAFVEYVYNSLDQLIESIDELGRSTEFEYDDLGRLVLTILPDPDGAGGQAAPEIAYAYNADGRLTTVTDPLGRDTSYTYGPEGVVTSITLPDHDGDTELTVTEFDHDDAGRVTEVTDPLGRVTTSVYNTLGWLMETILPDPDGAGSLAAPSIEHDYDALGRLVETTDALGNLTTVAWSQDGLEQTTTLADPDGAGPLDSPELLSELDPMGQLVSSSDALGEATNWTYDELGRVISLSVPGSGLPSSETLYEYDKASNLRFVTDMLGNITEHQYDARNRLIKTILPDPDGAGGQSAPELEWEYDDAGQLIAQTDAMGRVTAYEYDNLGRLIKIILPDPDGAGGVAASEIEYGYDLASRLTSVTDALGFVTEYEYDALDNRITVTQPDPDGGGSLGAPETSFTFDAVGNLLTLTDPVGNITAWTYDNLNRVIEEENELEDVRTFKYDAMSNLIEKIDRLGRKTVFVYDNLYRNTQEKWYDGSTLLRTMDFEYDAAGQLTEASDVAATYGFNYNGRGWVDSETQSFAGFQQLLTYARLFNSMGSVTQIDATIGSSSDFLNTLTYDNLQRVTRIVQEDSGNNVVAEKRADFSYDASGAVTQLIRYADAAASELVVTSTYDYDGAGRLVELLHKQGRTTLAGYELAYDLGSRITSIDSFLDGLTEYDHDNTSQLTAADHTGQTDEAYSFDENGNRTGGSYDVDPNNLLVSDGVYNYAYDAEGNRISRTKISNGYVTLYSWDHRNRLVTITEQDDEENVLSTVDQTYDVFNRLILISVDADGPGRGSAADTFFSYLDGQIVAQFDGDDESDLSHRYLWNPAAVDQLLFDEAVTSLAAAGDVLYPLGDHLGTLRDLAEFDGEDTTIVNHRRYESFGRLVSETNSAIDLIFGYTGRLFIEATGLQDNWHRPYDPLTGQFLSEDPLDIAAGDPNFHRYTENSPIDSTDPNGLWRHPMIPAVATIVRKPSAGDDSDTFSIWGQFKGGLLQGAANIGNGLQDAGAGILNFNIAFYNFIFFAPEPLTDRIMQSMGYTPYQLETIPYVPSPDWSRDLVVAESDVCHGVSKFVGAEGVITLATLGTGEMRHAGTLQRMMSFQSRRTLMFSEYLRFRDQGFTARQAWYLMQRYPLDLMGHHFPISQAVARRLGLPEWFFNSQLNVLRPYGISRGRFYELHYKLDRFFRNANFPFDIGGRWTGSALGLQRYGTIGQRIYGTPTGFLGTANAAGGAAGQLYQLNCDELPNK